MSEIADREELRQIVAQMYEELLAWKFWRGIGRIFKWLPGAKKTGMTLWLSSFLVIILSIFLCILLAWLIGAIEFFDRLNLIYIASMSAWIWLTINLAEWQIRQSLNSIQKDALDILELPKGEREMMKWAGFVTNRHNQLVATISFFILICTISTLGMKLDFSHALGWIKFLHLLLGTGWWSFHATWMVVLILFYGYHFRRWPTFLFQDDPASTVSLLNLHRCADQLLMVSALIATIGIPISFILNNFTQILLVTSAITLWFPLLAFYAVTEQSFSAQIRSSKDRRLTPLQNQITQLDQRTNILDTETLKRVQALLDLHERIRRTPNSLINVESLLNLFGSLALPLLGVLLNILDIWKKLFGIP